MSILRYTASIDNTITNAFKEDLKTRATDANMGQSDILEVFSIYDQARPNLTSSVELSRALIQFPVEQISTDRTAGKHSLGAVNFILKMYDAPHGQTVPSSYTMTVAPITKQWEEGYGLDMEEYTDVVLSGNIGSTWMTSSADIGWSSVGGDYNNSDAVTATFTTGQEDLEVDITSIVEKWILGSEAGGAENYGLGVRFSDAYEGYFSSSTGENEDSIIHNTSGQKKSYYTKKFFGRGTEFFFARPVIEAQIATVRKDKRGNFQISSSALPAANNKNKIYYYNYSQGALVDVGGDSTAQPILSLYYSTGTVPTGEPRGFLRASDNSAQTSISATRESAGVYYAEIAATSSIVDSDYPYLIDVWSMPDGTQFHTGSGITLTSHSPSNVRSDKNYVVSMPNLKKKYKRDQSARLKIYAREKNWSPNIYTKAQNSAENLIIEDAIYKVIRTVDNQVVIKYATGAIKYTSLSYDSSGNYFDLDMSLFESGYEYAICLSFYDPYVGSYVEQSQKFKFRVE